VPFNECAPVCVGDIGNGQRSNVRQNTNKLTPRRVMFRGIKKGSDIAKAPMKRIFCGGYSSFALDANGVLWVWGPNNFGQMGLESDKGTTSSQHPITLSALTFLVTRRYAVGGEPEPGGFPRRTPDRVRRRRSASFRRGQ
jgi:hypothetical protein